MSDFLFPAFEVYLANGTRLSKTEYASSNLGFHAGYGQAMAVTLTIVGNDAVFLEEVGDLEEGAVLTEVYGGYRDDEMVLIGKNLLIWDTEFSYDARTGSTLKVTAYGCSQLLRQSGQRTTKLTSKTYADAAKEVAARWGLTIGIGSGAYRAFQENSAAFKTQPGAIQEVGDNVTATPTPYQPADTGIPSDPNQPLPLGNTKVAGAARQVANGVRIPSLTSDTITDFELCAQFTRQVVEYGLGLSIGGWNVGQRAYAIGQQNHSRTARYATDYEQAARALNLNHGGDPEPGDVVFKGDVSLPFGHVGVYVGLYDGVPTVVENTTANRGTPVFGAGTPIRRTPLSSFGTPTTIARPAPAPARTGDTANSKPSVVSGGSVTGSYASKGIVATAKPVTPNGESKPRKIIMQENENDFEFLKKIGDEIGYVLTESPPGNALYFGAGLEVGSRERHLLVAGEYLVNGRVIPANITSYSSLKSIYGIPAEIVVTGFEDGKRFSLVVTPEDLAARHKTTTAVPSSSALPPASQPPKPNTNVTGSYASKGVTATAKPIDQPLTPKTKQRVAVAGAANYASSKVKTLLTGAYPTANRRVLGGASSRQDALEKGLEALALTQLAFQQVDVSVFGIPTIQRGDEVVLEGSLLPKNMRGLYLVRTIGGDVDSGNGYSMKLTLNRNTIG